MGVNASSSVPVETQEDAVRQALRTLLSANELKISERNKRFLAYVVEEMLAGRASRIKAYTIGVDVFGRAGDFDPAIDPIVRIEATRLRTALAAYYESTETTISIRIVMPPGGYTPIFERAPTSHSPATTAASAETPSPRSERRLSPIVVLDCGELSRECVGAARLAPLVGSVAEHLKEAGVRVFVRPTSDRKAAAKAVREMLQRPHAAYVLDLGLCESSENGRYYWSLMDLSTGEILAARARHDRLDGDALERVARSAALAVASSVKSRTIGLRSTFEALPICLAL
jgi:hypothetical protein